MATTVSFINFKGGVGKTTLCVEVGAALASKFSERVLIVDLDPQTNATLSLMKEEDWEQHSKTKGTLRDFFQSCYDDKPSDISQYIVKSPVKYRGTLDKLDLLPSHIELTAEFSKAIGYSFEFRVIHTRSCACLVHALGLVMRS